MSITVRTPGAQNSGTGTSITVSITPTAGDTLICCVRTAGAGTTVTVADDKSNTWSRTVARHFAVGYYGMEQWAAPNVAGAATVITVSASASVFISALVMSVGGLAAASIDKTASANGASSTTPDSGATTTTAQADELLVGFLMLSVATTVTEPANWTALIDDGQGDRSYLAYRVVSATGTYNYAPTLAANENWHDQIGTYKAATATAYTLTPTPGVFSLSGPSAATTFDRALIPAAGAFSLSAPSVNVAVGHVLIPTAGVYTLLGPATELTYTPAPGPTYTLTPTPGVYTLSAPAVPLAANRVLVPTPGVYTVIGPQVALSYTVSGWVAVQDDVAGAWADNTQSNTTNRNTSRFVLLASVSLRGGDAVNFQPALCSGGVGQAPPAFALTSADPIALLSSGDSTV